MDKPFMSDEGERLTEIACILCGDKGLVDEDGYAGTYGIEPPGEGWATCDRWAYMGPGRYVCLWCCERIYEIGGGR